jgi:hypothetical protein
LSVELQSSALKQDAGTPSTNPSTTPGPRPPARPAAGARGPLLLAGMGVLGTALLLRTQHLTDLSLHFDECCSWKISQFPWGEMLDGVSRDAHPPLYYILLKGLTAMLGDAPAVLRGFSVVMGMGTIAAAVWFVRTALAERDTAAPGRLLSERDFGALLAGVLVALSGLHVEMSLQARPYPLGTCLSLVAGAFLIRALRPGGRLVDWAGFTLAAAALSLTHYYGLFTVGALYLYAVGALLREWWQSGWSGGTRRLLAGIVCSAWAAQLIWAPWLPTFLFQQSRSTPQLWMAPLDWKTLSDTCYLALAGGQSTQAPPGWAGWAVVVWGALVLGVLVVGRPSTRLAAVCAGIPLAAVIAYGLIVRNILGAKYLIFAQLFVLIAAAVLTARVPWRFVRITVAAGLVGWSGYWCWDQAEAREYLARSPGVRGAVAYLEQYRRPEEPVVVGSPFVHPIVQYYARDRSGIYTRYHGDHRESMLSGPPLRAAEYQEVDQLLRQPLDRVWTIDSYGMFRAEGRFEADLPPHAWRLERQEEFREPNGIACVLAVRSYRRQPSGSAQTSVAAGPAASGGKISIPSGGL